MSNVEWEQGDGGDSWKQKWRAPRGKDPARRLRPLHFAAAAACAVIVVIVYFASSIVDFYTDVLWYESMSFDHVFWRRILLQVACFGAAAISSFVFIFANWCAAVRLARGELLRATGGAESGPIKVWHVALASAVFSLLFGMMSSGDWQTAAQFIWSSPFGQTDAIFGIDISFYVFELPFWSLIRGSLISLIFFAAVGSVGIYLAFRSLRFEDGSVTFIRPARAHAAILGSLAAFAVAAGIWLSRYDLLYSPTGIVFGMGYTDLNVSLPALSATALAAAAAGVLIVLNVFINRWRASAAIVGLIAAAGFVAQTIVPSIVQSYVVDPNEYEREKAFIAHHIEATRDAYGLSRARSQQIVPEQSVSVEEMRHDAETVANIRLWDYAPLLSTYKQLQGIRTYYDFNDIDIDRYAIGGSRRQVMLSVRELDLDLLQNRTWVNGHLEFTHGFGIVMNPVNEMEPGGLPRFFMKDLPPRTTVPIALDRPEIYYGERTNDYALVMTNVREFDHPSGDSNVRSTYAGKGGVAIGSLARRLLFAMKFLDSEIIFTDSLRPESRVLYDRNIRRAIQKVAPFLILDADAYPAVIGGRIIWIQDAYTHTSSYPYSLPLSRRSANYAGISQYAGVNYLRNSVKITVDAYDGTMALYITDPDDPIVRNWNDVFPGTFSPASEVPSELAEHFRYPEELFEVQSEIFRVYHMTDTNTFYNREDVWTTVAAGSDRRSAPNYVTMRLPDGDAPEFTLVSPFMPAGRGNLIGWMAARCDPERYGELFVYQFPKQELVYGPPQIEALIDQNTEISSQLSLWSQRGSEVIRGDLLVIPIGASLLYVEPLYLRAERGGLPELKRIILSTGGRVAWGETFEDAARKMFGTQSAPRPTQPDPAQGDRPAKSMDELAREAMMHYEAAVSASRSGDWARYGEEIRALGEILESMDRR